MRVRWLGRLPYAEALSIQEAIVSRKIAESGAPDEILLLEHEPVYTIGRTPDQTSLGARERLPHAVIQINRGGQATYHGPGQLIGYPIIDLRRRGQDLHRYLRLLESALIDALAALGVEANRLETLTGVWVDDRKIASIGIGVRHWVTMHGFALNVGGDLTPFNHITPCGIAGVDITSVERETGEPVEMARAVEAVSRATVARLAMDLSEEQT